MPPNRADYEMLNASMRGVGDAFRTSRLDEQAKKQREIETQLHTRQIQNQEKKIAADEAGTTEAWLTGDDGGLINFKGSPSGLQQFIDASKAQGKVLKSTSPPQRKASIGSFTTSTPIGDFTFHLDKPEDVDKVMEQAKKIGGQKKQPGQMKTAPDVQFEKLQSLDAAIASAMTPEAKQKAEKDKADYESLIPSRNVTETEKIPAVTGKPAVPGIPAVPSKQVSRLGVDWLASDEPEKPAVPEIPAVPGRGERTITRRVPATSLGQMPPPPAPAAARGDFVQPQDADDSDMNTPRATAPQSKTDSLIREAQKAIQMGADPAAVIKEAKEKHGVILTFK